MGRKKKVIVAGSEEIHSIEVEHKGISHLEHVDNNTLRDKINEIIDHLNG